MEEQVVSAAAPFPAPPPFYQHFTKPNLAQLRQIRKEHGIKASNRDATSERVDHDIDLSSLPPELRFLIPPEPPQDGRYRSFGAAFDADAPAETLAGQGIEQLYPPQPSVRLNPQPHLLALTRSLMTTFLSLVGVLSKNPELFESRVEDLQTMLYNIHELINEYRPHQARETLIMMMEERVERLREETKKIAECKEKVKRLAGELAEENERAAREDKTDEVADHAGANPHGTQRRGRQTSAWETLSTAVPDEQ